MFPTLISTTLGTGEPGASEPPERQRAPQLRQRRSQVAKACDGCRIHRVKCDNNKPCSNCESRGRHCSNSNVNKVSTLSEAHEEIGHLRQKIRDLEVKLENERMKTVNLSQPLHTPPSFSPPQVSYSGSIDLDHGVSSTAFWEGIQLRPARSAHSTWFGPSSLYYFIKRLSLYLDSSLPQSYSVDHMLPDSVSSRKLLDGPTAAYEEDVGRRIIPSVEDHNMTGVYLSPTQEEYFIGFFWQSYHTSLFSILDEAEFKEHHQSLWMMSGNQRKPSALVDIVLAMCMQYGISTLPAGKQGSIAENNDATIAGRWHYRRCQTLLTYEMESPTISTLQCHLLCAIYLCGASFHNMVDISCSLAVRTAYMLGLHLDPPQTMQQREREKRRRLWWAIYTLDSKIGMKLGRPFLLHDHHAMPHLPSDNVEAAMLSGSAFAPLGDNATWLSFNLHQTKLFVAARAAHTVSYDKDLNLPDGQKIWDNPQALEACAEVLYPYTKNLEEWVNGVPNPLKMKRQNDGCPLSTDGSALEIEQFVPLWLQRQRLLLELTYHNLCINLYRPFISLDSSPSPGLLAEDTSMKCALHAIALTKIVHQVLSSTSILDGWHEAFQWQWSAAMTLIGFVLAYPQGLSTLAARDAIDISLSVLDIFGNSFAVAAGAANIVRDLCKKVDFLAGQNRAKQNDISDIYQAADKMMPIANFGELDEQTLRDNNFGMEDLMTTDLDFYDVADGPNQNLVDMALAVDFWGDFDTLWPSTAISPEQWALTQ